MFKNLSIYKITSDMSSSQFHQVLTSALEQHSAPSGQTPVDTHWVHPSSDAGIVYSVDGFFLVRLKKIKKSVPSSYLNEQCKIALEKMDQLQGFRPGRKQAKEIKEDVKDKLLSQALPSITTIDAIFDLKNGNLFLDTKSASSIDEFFSALRKSNFNLEVDTHEHFKSPKVLTEWLFNHPEQFSVGQTTLKLENQGRSVKYSQHSFDENYINQLVAMGNKVSQIAIEWDDGQLSFVLDDKFTLSRITFDKSFMDPELKAIDEHDRFSSDLAIIANTFSKLSEELKKAIEATQN